MKGFSFLLFLCLFFFQMCSVGKVNRDEALSRGVRSQFNAAIVRQDTMSMTSFWSKDYSVVSSRNFEAHGIEANRHLFASEFRTKKEVVYIRAPKRIEVFSDWNMASETGVWEGSWLEGEGKIKVSGSYFAKWHKVDGVWKIRIEVFVPLRCDGGDYCNRKPF